MKREVYNSILLSRAEAAKQLNLQVQTLASWACAKRYDLRYVKIGSRVAYRQSDIDAFLAANTIGGI